MLDVGPAQADPQKPKPKLRGIPDVIAVVIALPAVACLVFYSRAGTATQSALVYGSSVVLLFAVSAIYHTPMWPLSTRLLLRRIDHSTIYVLIAGSYTPTCLMVLPESLGKPLLLTVWGATLLGVIKSFFWPTAPRWLNTTIYLGLGWIMAPLTPHLYGALGSVGLGLIAFGGLLYSVGAVIYARRWPNPKPAVFGYHELFHVFVVLAGASHFVAFWRLLT